MPIHVPINDSTIQGLTIGHISEILGISRERTGQIITQLESEGLIEKQQGMKIHIPDIGGLENALSFSNAQGQNHPQPSA